MSPSASISCYGLKLPCTMVTVKIKGMACGGYKVYTVVTTSHSHGITA